MKKKMILVLAAAFMLPLAFSTIANAGCNPGKESTGKQSWGGTGNGSWELVCDQTSPSICCFSHDNKVLDSI